jgi:hypothetical protein
MLSQIIILEYSYSHPEMGGIIIVNYEKGIE